MIRSATRSRLPGFILILIGGIASQLNADDWKHWRGPHWNDISTEKGLLKKWPAGGPPQVWINKKAGLGYAGFAVVGDRLYTMGLEDGQEFALCLNSQTGTEIWRKNIGPEFENNWGNGPRSTPSVDQDRVYCLSARGNLVCLKTVDGSIVWKQAMQNFGGKTPNWGYAESPLVDGNKVVCTPGGPQGTILALDKMTGKKIWQSPPITKPLEEGRRSRPAPAHYASMIPVDWNGQRQYIQLTVLALVGISAEDGSILWQSDWPGRTAVIPSPIFSNGQVYATSGYGIGSKLIELKKGNKVEQRWYTKAMKNHHGGVIRVGDYFYGASAGGFICQSAKTGEAKWAEPKIKKGAVAYADGLFYFLEESTGRVLLFSANEKRRDLRGLLTLEPQSERRKPDGRIWVHPVIANGKLYLRDQEIIYCYDIKR